LAADWQLLVKSTYYRNATTMAGSPRGAARNVVGILRGLISSDVKLSDCRFAFKQLLGREGEPLGSPLVSFLRGVRYLSTPFLSVSITRRDRLVARTEATSRCIGAAT
jgi:hypothetical protein